MSERLQSTFANQQRAEMIDQGDTLLIKTPTYNSSFVSAIKTFKGAYYERNSTNPGWIIPKRHQEQALRMTRNYFFIRGEPLPEYETITAIVSGGNSVKRTQPGGVRIDGRDLIDMRNGSLQADNPVFQILGYSGGRTNIHGAFFEVEYTLQLLVRKQAQWSTYGNNFYRGGCQIISEEADATHDEPHQ